MATYAGVWSSWAAMDKDMERDGVSGEQIGDREGTEQKAEHDDEALGRCETVHDGRRRQVCQRGKATRCCGCAPWHFG